MLQLEHDEAPGASRARRVLRRATGLLGYLAVVVLAVLLWPTSLGGCTTLTIVSGHSMEPTYYTGDLVVARCGEPHTGDVVVYQPKNVGGARIIHRIVGGDSSGWTMQGDNNSWVDPFTPGNDEILGIAKIHLPKVGLVAKFVTSPLLWLSLLVIAFAILVWPPRDEEIGEGQDGDKQDRQAVDGSEESDEPLGDDNTIHPTPAPTIAGTSDRTLEPVEVAP